MDGLGRWACSETAIASEHPERLYSRLKYLFSEHPTGISAIVETMAILKALPRRQAPRIDPEFQALIPPLKPEERRQLESKRRKLVE